MSPAAGRALFLLPLLLGLLLRLYRFDAFSLDRDELASAGWSLSGTWVDLIGQLRSPEEGNLPGYPVFLLALSGLFPPTPALLRVPSLLAGTLLILLPAFAAPGRRPPGMPLLLASLIAASPFLIRISQWARGYSMSLLLLALLWLLLLHRPPGKLSREGRQRSGIRWVAAALAGAAACLLHYANFLYLLILFGSAFLRADRGERRICGFAAAAALSPLLLVAPLIAFQLRNGPRWIPQPSMALLPELTAQFAGGGPAVFAILLLPLAVGAWRSPLEESLLLLLPPLFLLLLSLVWRPLFVPLYFAPSVFFFLRLVAGGVAALAERSRFAWLLAVLHFAALPPGLRELFLHVRGDDFAGLAGYLQRAAGSCSRRVAVEPLMLRRWPIYLNGFELHSWYESAGIRRPFWLVIGGHKPPAYLEELVRKSPEAWVGAGVGAACVRE